jgi:hypothetical protein
MTTRMMCAAMIMILIVPYGYGVFHWMSLEAKKERITQDQEKVNQSLVALQERTALSSLWNKNKEKLPCLSHQSDNQLMQWTIHSLKNYPDALKELRHQNDALDIQLSMPTQYFFDWLLSDSFQHSCLSPTTIHMNNSLGFLTIQIHLSQVSHG